MQVMSDGNYNCDITNVKSFRYNELIELGLETIVR